VLKPGRYVLYLALFNCCLVRSWLLLARNLELQNNMCLVLIFFRAIPAGGAGEKGYGYD